MSDKHLIPFSKELWKSGKYEAVTVIGETAIIYQIDEGRAYGRLYNHATVWLHDGSNINKPEWDLMLRKKIETFMDSDLKYWMGQLDSLTIRKQLK